MLEKFRLLEETGLSLLQGNKIPFLPTNTWIRETFADLSGRMHAAHFISAEPQTFVEDAAYRHVDPKYMGRSTLHSISTALHRQAESLKGIAIQKGVPITPFEVFGLNHSKRETTKAGQDFEADPGKIPVLTRGDHVAFTQAMNVARRREENPDIRYTVPIILQNSDHYWQAVFKTNDPSWPAEKEHLKRLNVHFTSGRAETVDLLAALPYGQKIQPQDIQVDFGVPAGPADPNLAFATTDLLKFDQTDVGHQELNANGLLRRLLEIVGPFQSPTEESYSYEGNAEDEKFRAIYNLFKTLGTPAVRQLFSTRGYGDPDQVKIVSHDGGLGFCLENAAGERRIDLFTEEHFPNSVHKLNPLQMSPGVELAYLKRTEGLEVTMERLSNRVREIVAEDPRFTVDDLCAYDTSMFVGGALNKMLEAIDRGEEYDPVGLGIVSVFDAQKLKVSEKPQFAPHQTNHVPETENYLIPYGETQTRSLLPDWVLKGPNVTSYKLMRAYIGASNDPAAFSPRLELSSTEPIRMGLLGTPEMINTGEASASYDAVDRYLQSNHNIFTQRPNVWRVAYKDRPRPAFIAASTGQPSNPHYLSNMKNLLNHSSVLYFGKPDQPFTDEQKVDAYLLLIKAMVRNQVYNRTENVVDRVAYADVIRLLEHKQALGLVGQQTKHLIHAVNGPEEAAKKIAEIVRKNLPDHTPVNRHFFTDQQVENKECPVLTVYLSASNCNKEALDDAWKLGFLAKANGITLKTGGGNDGLMKAVNDGFMAAEKELLAKGYNFPNQLINIQCVDTEAIEKPYEGGGLYRCHPDIEARKADLQACDGSAVIDGGIGTDEEIIGRMKSALLGLINPQTNPQWVMNSQRDSVNGKVGVYDPYREMFSAQFLKEMNFNFVSTPEGIIDQFVSFRAGRETIHEIPFSALEKTLRGEMDRATGALSIKRFRTPYGIFLGRPGEIPAAITPKADMATHLQMA